MRVLSIFTFTVFVQITKPMPYQARYNGKQGKIKRQQVAAPAVHLVNGRVEAKAGIILVNKQGKTKFDVVHVPILENKKGVPFEITDQENGKSYLTGPALRILNRHDQYDASNPFFFFPIIKANHFQS